MENSSVVVENLHCLAPFVIEAFGYLPFIFQQVGFAMCAHFSRHQHAPTGLKINLKVEESTINWANNMECYGMQSISG